MPPMPAKRPYRGSSCHRCHRQKVKCSKGNPCRNCSAANRPCTYAVPDRKVTVNESYLQRLQSAAATAACLQPATDDDESCAATTPRHALATTGVADAVVADSTAELFVSKLRETERFVSTGRPSAPGASSAYEYIALGFDTMHVKCTFRLPPYPYAMCLVDQFLTYVGHDWHWFCLRTFRERLEATYKVSGAPESRDRVWLCKLLVVFAIGKAFNGEIGDIEISTEGYSPPEQQDVGVTVAAPTESQPGKQFFEQALQLLKVPYEEVQVEHIEVLNLVALYSCSLNRKKTAYMHAGAAARISNILTLHRASTSKSCTPVEREHRKRLWWSTFCLDRMTSTQLGVLPSLYLAQTDLDYPSPSPQGMPRHEAVAEFSDADLMTARVDLTAIQDANASQAAQLGREDAAPGDVDAVVRPTLIRLLEWQAKLPAHLALGVGVQLPNSTSLPFVRSFANLHIRYNQCMILLLRPLLLKKVRMIFLGYEHEDARDMYDHCLRSARTNVRLLIHLQSRGLLVRRGFMENTHLFSSMVIMSLAMAIDTRCPDTFTIEPDDAVLYQGGKCIIYEMIQAGSVPAKGFEKMLRDVEELGGRISHKRSSPDRVDVMKWDDEEWVTQLLLDAENGLDGS